MLSPVGFNPVSYYRPSVKPQPAFGSAINKFPKDKFLKMTEFVSSSLPVDFRDYQFLLRNPAGFYLECGKDVNKFLRSGAFEALPDLNAFPPVLRDYGLSQIAEKKAYNRTLVESIESLDKLMRSETTGPMVVYRDAPSSWLRTVQNGKLTDKGYLSTSTVRGASLEGMLSNGADNMTYAIQVPAGVKFFDLRHTQEKEMLFGRNHEFEILAPGVLRMIK